MAKQPTIERSENYGYYSDLLWCAVPLTGMAWYYYGLRADTQILLHPLP